MTNTNTNTNTNDATSVGRSGPPGKNVKVKARLARYRTRSAVARDFARGLRKKSTKAEKRMWRLLRDRRFAQFKFRRQYPCGVYFLDFFCTLAQLAVELDGGGHGFPNRRRKDELRNKFLAERGIKVLRFWNRQLRDELEAMRFEIWHALMERTGGTEQIAAYLPKPSLSPIGPIGGEGQGEGATVRTSFT